MSLAVKRQPTTLASTSSFSITLPTATEKKAKTRLDCAWLQLFFTVTGI